MTASQRKLRAGGIEHGPLVRIMPWGQAVQWQLPVLMAQAQIRFAKQLHDLLLGEGVTIGHSRVHELVTEAPARLTVEVQFALCRVLNCSPSDLWLDLHTGTAVAWVNKAGGIYSNYWGRILRDEDDEDLALFDPGLEAPDEDGDPKDLLEELGLL
jgi:DNA-binding Xre family transcriptional regulator